jgi:hypothetical protein
MRPVDAHKFLPLFIVTVAVSHEVVVYVVKLCWKSWIVAGWWIILVIVPEASVLWIQSVRIVESKIEKRIVGSVNCRESFQHVLKITEVEFQCLLDSGAEFSLMTVTSWYLMIASVKYSEETKRRSCHFTELNSIPSERWIWTLHTILLSLRNLVLTRVNKRGLRFQLVRIWKSYWKHMPSYLVYLNDVIWSLWT